MHRKKSMPPLPGCRRRTAPTQTTSCSLSRNLRDRLSLVGLDEREYFQTLEASAAGGIASSAIDDSLLGHCALKSGAETIYTWNTKDFLRLPPSIASRVKTPDQAGI